MRKLKSDIVIEDRLSELPDSLILEILSLLDIRDVVRTSLLSKHWKNLWITIPCLKFLDLGRGTLEKSVIVNRTLKLWRGTHLREFKIGFDSEASLSMDMDLWVQFATERKVEDLCVVSIDSLCCPPQCLYECSSIRKLLLSGCNLQIRGNVKWDRLNTLKLDKCVISEDVMNQVLSSSPQLETFTICFNQRFQNLSIRSCSLKKLSIGYFNYNPYVLTIWAPNLRVLTCSGSPYAKCLLTDISSLTEVRLDFTLGNWDVAVKKALCQILPVIQHVVSLQLSATCFKVLRHINKGNCSFSPLLNVKLLTIDSLYFELSNKDFIVGLLESFPKLEMLIINWKSVRELPQYDAENYTESEANILKSNLLQLRTVVITTRYVYEASFFELTRFLLKNATMIEKMVIRREGAVSSEKMFEQEKTRMSLQRSFPNVELAQSMFEKYKLYVMIYFQKMFYVSLGLSYGIVEQNSVFNAPQKCNACILEHGLHTKNTSCDHGL